MATYDNKRFYWIKLSESFMTSDTVDYLMSQKNGANYVVLYQMLCLKTVNTNGELVRHLGEVIVPFDAEKIQRDCKYFDIDTVRVALGLYQNLGLIYTNENGIFVISNFDRLIGSTTVGAEKKQEQIARRNQLLLEGGNQGGKKVENFPPDIEIRDRDKEIDIKRENCLLKINKKITEACASPHTREMFAFEFELIIAAMEHGITLSASETYGGVETTAEYWDKLLESFDSNFLCKAVNRIHLRRNGIESDGVRYAAGVLVGLNEERRPA